MAVVGETYLTLADKLKVQDSNGEIISEVIEMLSETNDLLLDAEVQECNDGTKHKTVIRAKMPDISLRAFYEGVKPSKSGYGQVEDATCMMDAYSEVDKDLADLNGNTSAFRLLEAQSFIQAMNDTCQDNILYGSKKTDAKAFDGIAVRYNKYSSTKGSAAYNVIDGGGRGSDNTSIYAITWGKAHTSLIYPKGSVAGLTREDKGQQTSVGDSGQFEIYREHFTWKVGLSIRDWRSSGRIANIDVSALETSGAADLVKLMVKLDNKIERWAKTGRTVYYVNTTVKTALELQVLEKTNVHLSYQEAANGGGKILTFRGKPVRLIDQILDTEDAVPSAA